MEIPKLHDEIVFVSHFWPNEECRHNLLLIATSFLSVISQQIIHKVVEKTNLSKHVKPKS